MPDSPDFDAARRALEEVPPPDLWPEAERRAAAGGVVPLVPDRAPGRRPGRWLAAAAVAALVVGTVAVLAADDDGQLDTAPGVTTTPTPMPTATPPSTVLGADGCRFGITPPADLLPGPPDPPIFDAKPQSADQTVVHKDFDTQVLEIRVPGQVVIDLVGERVEQVELERGTADVWFGPDFVQVRWFTGSQESCASFTVTVAGGTEDGNRHAAVDWAERISLPHDPEPVDDAPLSETLPGTAWRVVQLYRGGQVVPFDQGQLHGRLDLTFADDGIGWDDGCNDFGGPVTIDDAGFVSVGEVMMTLAECADPEERAVRDAIGAVMGAGRIAARFTGDRLELSGGAKDRIVLERV
jgi:heat shock protein HslJ